MLITLQPVNILQCAADLMWSPVLRKFPDLRVALSEGGIGWIPYLLERLDWIYTRHHAWTGQDFGSRLPSDVFRERIVTCFIDDPTGVVIRDRVGIDSICWEADYPHSDSTWPTSPEFLMKSLDGVPDADIDKISHLNAMRHFRFDPFSVRPREECTVGALRRKAADDGRRHVAAVRRVAPHRPARHQLDLPHEAPLILVLAIDGLDAYARL